MLLIVCIRVHHDLVGEPFPVHVAELAACSCEAPDCWTMGEVFGRLIEDVASGNDLDTLREVFAA